MKECGGECQYWVAGTYYPASPSKCKLVNKEITLASFCGKKTPWWCPKRSNKDKKENTNDYNQG